MKRNTLYVIAILLVSLMSYQNCSMVGSSHNEVNSLGKTCATILQRTYRDTYYPHLRDQCTSCHADGGRGRIYFASYNFDEAARNFLNTGRPKIEALMLTEGHQSNPYNGLQQQPFIDRYRSTWAKAETEAENCAANSAVQTTSKNTPTGNQVNADSGDTNTEKWRVLEWDLFTETKRADLAGKINLIVNLQYRRLVLGGEVVGYEFRRPTGRLRAGAPAGSAYTLDNLTIYRNSELLANATAYQAVLVTINTTTASPLIAGGNSPAPVAKKADGVTPDMDISTDMFSLRFAEIRDPNGNPIIVAPETGGGGGGGGGSLAPARVTYADLMGTSNVGVFARNCVSCHNANNKQGALDLTNYASAQVVASSIKSRTRNAQRPMPTSGLLPQFEQDVIARWVDLGAPQN